MRKFMGLCGVFSVMMGLVSIPAMGQKVEPQNGFFPAYAEQMRDGVNFRLALEDGDVPVVKNIVENHAGAHLLTTPVLDRNSKKVSPVCIAAGAGQNEMVRYMLDVEPSLVKNDLNVLRAALDNGHADTAMLLLANQAPTKERGLLPRAAKTVKEYKPLKELIPALLNAGAGAGELLSVDNSYSADAFFFASDEKNSHFVTILRDEMQKRNENPVSRYYLWQCEDYYLTSWGISKEEIEQDRAAKIKEIQNSKAALFLKKNGVEFVVEIKWIDNEELCH